MSTDRVTNKRLDITRIFHFRFESADRHLKIEIEDKSSNSLAMRTQCVLLFF